MKKLAVIVALALATLALPAPAMAAPPDWNMTGSYTIDFYLTSPSTGDYIHSMDISVVTLVEPGTFSGSGSYVADPLYTWTVTGTLSGSDLAFHILYTGTGAGYTVDAIGKVAADGSLSGTATSPGQTFNWWSTAGHASSLLCAHFLPPLTAGVHNMVQKGQVVPVKVTVDCGGVFNSGLAPAIQLLKGDRDPSTDPDDSNATVTASVSNADTTGIMREVDGQYIYNLRVPSDAYAVKGAAYTISVSAFGAGTAAVKVLLEIRK